MLNIHNIDKQTKQRGDYANEWTDGDYRTKKRVKRNTSLKMVAYESEENSTRMRMNKMMG